MDVELGLSRADRLNVGESRPSHALLFTGVSFDQDDCPTSFRVESLDEKTKEKDFLTMSCRWFSEFVFQVAIDKKFLKEKVLKVFEQNPNIISAWDSLGSLVL